MPQHIGGLAQQAHLIRLNGLGDFNFVDRANLNGASSLGINTDKNRFQAGLAEHAAASQLDHLPFHAKMDKAPIASLATGSGNNYSQPNAHNQLDLSFSDVFRLPNDSRQARAAEAFAAEFSHKPELSGVKQADVSQQAAPDAIMSRLPPNSLMSRAFA